MRINTFNFPDTFSNDGRVLMKEGVPAINQDLGLMIKCQRPQLRGDPNFGSKLRRQKYSQNTTVLRNQIKDDIIILTQLYDTRVLMTAKDVDVSLQDNYFYANCQYYLKSEDSQFGFEIGL